MGVKSEAGTLWLFKNIPSHDICNCFSQICGDGVPKTCYLPWPPTPVVRSDRGSRIGADTKVLRGP